MQESVFTKIINGEVHQRVIYQDERCFVILSHMPINPGHLLVIPRQQIDHLWDVPNDIYLHLQQIAKNMAELLRRTYDYERIGSMVDGYGVPHAHIHVFGLNEGLEPTIVRFVAGHGEAAPEELSVIADRLRAAL